MKKLIYYGLLVMLWGFILMISFNFGIPWEVPSKFKHMENPYDGDQDPDRVGYNLYKTHCKSCHGKTGLGDGTKAAELETEMRDLTSDEVQSQTDGELYYKGIMGRDEMANFEKKIPDEEDRWLLINYIRSLQ